MILFGAHLAVLAAALVLDAVFGQPAWLWGRVPHPVALVGRLVSTVDRAVNRSNRRGWILKTLGGATVVILLIGSLACGWLLEAAFRAIPFGWVGTTIVTTVLFTGRDLYDRVRAVAAAFERGGIELARAAFARIDGGDAVGLDEARVCRGTIAAAASGFSDGLVAPAFWFASFGLPGLLACKAVSIADSAVGHLTLRHRDFGWAAARLDDLFNLPAGRLAGLLLALAAPLAKGSIGNAARVMRADAPRHRSPNAGWPEAAMASALGVTLGGPRRYGGILVDDVYLNEAGRREARPTDVRRALRVYLGAGAVMFLLVAMIAGTILLLAQVDFRGLFPGTAPA